MGLGNYLIPSGNISISSQKNSKATVDTIRMGNPTAWTAASSDKNPWIEIRFPQSKTFQKENLF